MTIYNFQRIVTFRSYTNVGSKLLFSQSNTTSSILLEEKSDQRCPFATNVLDFIALSLITYVRNHEDKRDERISSTSLPQAHRERGNNGFLDSLRSPSIKE